MSESISRGHENDLISRREAIENSFEVYTKEYGWCEVVGVDVISELPSAQPERKKGKWNKRKGMYEVGYKCSECDAFSIAETPHCSFCGADMRGEGNETG